MTIPHERTARVGYFTRSNHEADRWLLTTRTFKQVWIGGVNGIERPWRASRGAVAPTLIERRHMHLMRVHRWPTLLAADHRGDGVGQGCGEFDDRLLVTGCHLERLAAGERGGFRNLERNG